MSKRKIIVNELSNYCESLKYCFGEKNVIYTKKDEEIKDIEKIATELNDCSNIVFFNLNKEAYLILNMLPKQTNISVIFEYSISEFSTIDKFSELLLILKYLDMGIIKNVYCINKATYELFKDKYKFKYLQLDIKVEEKCSGNTVGIISDPEDYYSGIVNELSALTFTDYNEVRLNKPIKPVIKFCKDFKLKVKKEKNIRATLCNNEINLYVNFCGTSYPLILESMDRGIPCIVGNTDFFDDNKVLKKFLVMKSDDDINELKDRILEVKENKKIIFEEYKKFRKNYTSSSKKTIKAMQDDLKIK